MNRPKQLTDWDFPDTKWIPNGYDMTQAPDFTADNFTKLLDKHNELVELVNLLADKAGIEFTDSE